MKAINRILAVLAVALLLAVGTVLVWARVNHRLPERLRMPVTLGDAVHNAHHAGRFGALLIVVGLGWIVTSFPFRRGVSYIRIESAEGVVRVSVSAIADLLGRVGAGLPSVVSVRPVIRARGERLRVDLHCRVQAGASVPELSRILRQRVRETLQRGIGVGEIETVAVTIRGIVGEAPMGPSEPYSDYEGGEPRITGMVGRADAAADEDDALQR